MLEVTVMFDGKIPYNAASVKANTNDVNKALEYAYRWTQNIMGSWSNKIGEDANDNVTVLHYNNSGMGLRSSMVGDTFTVYDENDNFTKYKCMPMGFEKIND